jgi:hypothetical protein
MERTDELREGQLESTKGCHHKQVPSSGGSFFEVCLFILVQRQQGHQIRRALEL